MLSALANAHRTNKNQLIIIITRYRVIDPHFFTLFDQNVNPLDEETQLQVNGVERLLIFIVAEATLSKMINLQNYTREITFLARHALLCRNFT